MKPLYRYNWKSQQWDQCFIWMGYQGSIILGDAYYKENAADMYSRLTDIYYTREKVQWIPTDKLFQAGQIH